MTPLEALLGHTLISPDNTWGLLAVMCLSVALTIALEQRYRWASRVSGAMIALVFSMAMANLGVIPTRSVLYDDIVWGFFVPMGIPLLMLRCNVRKIWRETGQMLAVFLTGAAGTVAGGFLAFSALRPFFGDDQGLAQVTAMMTGTYIGGSVNLAAMARQFVAADSLCAAATVADNLLMTLYFFALIAFARMRFFRERYPHPHIDEAASGQETGAQTRAAAYWSRKDISLRDIALNLAFCTAVVWVSSGIASLFAPLVPEQVETFAGGLLDFAGRFFGSQYVWITTLSVAAATFFDRQVERIHGSQEIGTYFIYLFLFVIGAPASIVTVVTEAPLLLVLTAIMVAVNMLFCFTAAKLLHFDLEDAIIASNANIGGPTTAAGMAVSQGWGRLVGPAMLVGTLGYVLGNYAGTVVGIVLGA